MTLSRFISMGFLCALPFGASAQPIAGLGVMGDSLSDEYLDRDFSYAKNWVEQLRIYRGINLGPTAGEADQPEGTWQEPRRMGYEFDWARAGATSQTLLEMGQHTAMAQLVTENRVSHSLLLIGANDYIPIPKPGIPYYEIYTGNWGAPQIEGYALFVAGNIQETLATVRPTGASIVMCTIPDYGNTPWAQEGFPVPGQRDRVTAAIGRANTHVFRLARANRVVVVDMFTAGQRLFGTTQAPIDEILLGNVPVFLRQNDTPENTNPQATFVDDGVHIHTTLQGLLANLIVEGLNVHGADVTRFTEAEILEHAGIMYGGSDTIGAQLGEFGGFVYDFRCAANYNGNGGVNSQDFFDFIIDFFAGDADFNSSGETNSADFFEFVEMFLTGC